MLQSVTSSPQIRGDDVRVIFVNGFIGKTVRQGLLGGPKARNQAIQMQMVDERVRQACIRFDSRDMCGYNDGAIDQIFVVGEQNVLGQRASDISTKLRGFGIPRERIVSCGDATRMVEAAHLFFMQIVTLYYGHRVRVHLAVHPLWFVRMNDFLKWFQYFNHEIIPKVLVRECFPIAGYVPNRYETVREWICQSDVQQAFHIFTNRVYLDYGRGGTLKLSPKMRVQ